MTKSQAQASRQNLKPDEQELLAQIENREWTESLEYVLASAGSERVREILAELDRFLYRSGVRLDPGGLPFINTIPPGLEPAYPGDLALEERISAMARWNAVAMVVRANKEADGIGGHLGSYASIAELYEVGYNHFFRGSGAGPDRDLVFWQGHSSPGNYARSFLEGRLEAAHLEGFRRELSKPKSLSSYPHPWLMPDYWEFPTVSMGLGPIMSIYQARFHKYLQNRGLLAESNAKVWCFIGDGESDEPEVLGPLSIAARERLDNLIWVVNANLQRLDGPVRGNGKVITELENRFLGAGWNVIKVLWGHHWDALLERDDSGVLSRRLAEVVDGWWQKYVNEPPDFFRQHFFGADPELEALGRELSDQELHTLVRDRGGHDPVKIYAAYQAASQHRGSPTVILAQTIKGYGLGKSAEAKNVSHQIKKLDSEALLQLRDRLQIPVSDQELRELPFYKPQGESAPLKYLQERRQALGGPIPERRVRAESLPVPGPEFYREFQQGSGEREISTTIALIRMLSRLMRDKQIAKYLVPIIPDELRTFGMEGLVGQFGIYSPVGQLYDPVDAGMQMYYREAKDGQILEEGITEAGGMSSFIAAGTSYLNYGVPTIPFFIFYSMFGMQRIGDLIWAAAEQRTRGFLFGATSGRTTMLGEGLQHQDGHSQVFALSFPNLKAYDPAYAYELAVIIEDGLRRMYQEGEGIFYYITVLNENYLMPVMPEPVEEVRQGIIKGIYPCDPKPAAQVSLLGSGAILNEVRAAAGILAEFGVQADVYSVTSYKELRDEAITVARHNRLHPEDQLVPYVAGVLGQSSGPVIAASDYLRVLPDALAPYLSRKVYALGAEGFGRSDTREALRDFFEVDRRYVAYTALVALAEAGTVPQSLLKEAQLKLGLAADRPAPFTI